MAYSIPGRTVFLGEVLDLTFEIGDERVRVDAWHGWAILVSDRVFDHAPGRARIYLAKTWSDGADELGADERVEGQAAYQRWHQRDPELVREIEVPDEIAHRQGRLLRIGYRSDKWDRRGTTHDYDHDFSEHDHMPPYLWTDRADVDASTAAVIVGGDMAVTEEGID